MEIGTIKALIVGLLAWLNMHTGYAVPVKEPVIAFVPHSALEQMACRGPCPVLGFYADENVVYLEDRLNLETNVCARSILLHELVHYLQDRTDRFADEEDPAVRWQLREMEAYRIQNYYLAMHGKRLAYGRYISLRAALGPHC